MPEYMDFRLLLIILFICVFQPFTCEGQEISYTFGTMSKEDFQYRNFKRGIIVTDTCGVRQLQSEPIYEDIRLVDGMDLVVVSIPLNCIDSANQKYTSSRIWLCADKALKPIFYFPLNTKDVQVDTTLNMFLYTDVVSVFSGHWYRRGVIDYSGNVVLESNFSCITRKDDDIIAVEDVPSPNNLIYSRSVVTHDMRNNERWIIHCEDIVPPYTSVDTVQQRVFEQAWSLLIIGELRRAKKTFKDSSIGEDLYLRNASKHNMRALNMLINKRRKQLLFAKESK